MIQSDLKRAHIAARYNKEALKKDKNCGCFYCVKVFSPSEIVEWIPEEDDEKLETALCPFCGIDAVLPESAGFPLNEAFLEKMNIRWFSTAGERTLMDKALYTEDKMERIHSQIRKLAKIVNELESDFPGRRFTLDGHLVGSIGEVVAAYHYGISLYTASAPVHDGEIGKRKVQIKITQRESIVINREPDYLIVLYMNKKGDFYEVYNGPGKTPWETASKPDGYNNRHILVNKLLQLDETVDGRRRIKQKHPIEKMKKEYKNK